MYRWDTYFVSCVRSSRRRCLIRVSLHIDDITVKYPSCNNISLRKTENDQSIRNGYDQAVTCTVEYPNFLAVVSVRRYVRLELVPYQSVKGECKEMLVTCLLGAWFSRDVYRGRGKGTYGIDRNGSTFVFVVVPGWKPRYRSVRKNQRRTSKL